MSVSACALLLGGCSSGIWNMFGLFGTTNQKIEQSAGVTTASSLIRIADTTMASGDPALAIGFYNRASQLNPGSAEAQFKLGFALYRMGANREAESAFRRALAAQPGNVDAMRGLGHVLVALDRPTEAADLYRAAAQTKPDYRLHNGLGVALDMIGRRGAAQAAYRAGLALKPKNLSLQNNLGLSLALDGKTDEAIRTLRIVVANPRASIRHRQNLALAYGLAGRTKDAARTILMDMNSAAVQNNLAYYAWLRSRPVHANTLLGSAPSPATKRILNYPLPQAPAATAENPPRTDAPAKKPAAPAEKPAAEFTP